ncbi:NAD(P)-binding protein [Biscogniauxia sp. FL1348]|nr:NAD(P)-binding protein [Biscogniauxia sp. FL1348]
MLEKHEANNPLNKKTVVVTGGSSGMGLEVGRQLAEKGANVVIIARGQEKLRQGIDYIQNGALHPQSQRFHYISADLSNPSEAVRVMDEIVAWNASNPPDIVWCCAGSAHPTLFVDTPVPRFHEQMDSNYFTGMHMAHAALTCWLKTSRKQDGVVEAPDSTTTTTVSPTKGTPLARHLIFTSTFLAFYSFAGWSPYSPCKAALRGLSDTLSQEMNLYAAAHPSEPRVRVHTVFPATILSESFEAENRIKTDLSKMLEEGDDAQTPHVVAAKSIKGLETGQELVTTNLVTWLVKRSMLGGSVRGGFWRALLDWVVASLMALVMIFVRDDMDRKVRAWGRKLGDSGMKGDNKSA